MPFSGARMVRNRDHGISYDSPVRPYIDSFPNEPVDDTSVRSDGEGSSVRLPQSDHGENVEYPLKIRAGPCEASEAERTLGQSRAE